VGSSQWTTTGTSIYYNTGNVGIGTSVPTAPLHILSTAGYNGIVAEGGTNTYFQLNIKNTNGGNAASSDLIATANTGTESSGYVDVGINSSTYNQADTMGGALDSYIYSVGVGTTGGNLSVGSGTTDTNVKIFNGLTAANETARFTTSGVEIGRTGTTVKTLKVNRRNLGVGDTLYLYSNFN
jgi:hypothetical protein